MNSGHHRVGSEGVPWKIVEPWIAQAATCELLDRVRDAGSLGTPLAHWHNPVRLDPSIEISFAITDLPPEANVGRTYALKPPTG